jgi:hypothetical protein
MEIFKEKISLAIRRISGALSLQQLAILPT